MYRIKHFYNRIVMWILNLQRNVLSYVQDKVFYNRIVMWILNLQRNVLSYVQDKVFLQPDCHVDFGPTEKRTLLCTG